MFKQSSIKSNESWQKSHLQPVQVQQNCSAGQNLALMQNKNNEKKKENETKRKRKKKGKRWNETRPDALQSPAELLDESISTFTINEKREDK